MLLEQQLIKKSTNFFPFADKVYELSCRFNLQWCHFESDGICKDAVAKAPSIMHGCGYHFQVQRNDSYKYIGMYRVHEAFKNVKSMSSSIINYLSTVFTFLKRSTE